MQSTRGVCVIVPEPRAIPVRLRRSPRGAAIAMIAIESVKPRKAKLAARDANSRYH